MDLIVQILTNTKQKSMTEFSGPLMTKWSKSKVNKFDYMSKNTYVNYEYKWRVLICANNSVAWRKWISLYKNYVRGTFNVIDSTGDVFHPIGISYFRQSKNNSVFNFNFIIIDNNFTAET